MSSTPKSSTKTKTKITKKPANAAKKPRAYPSYLEMVKEAILALKERSGSSQIAIAKYTEEKQKNLPANFKKLLSVQLKKLVADGRLVKVKNSYKVPSKVASADKPAKKVVAKPKADVKPKKASVKAPVKAKKSVKAVPKKSPAKKKVKTPVKAAKKPKSIKSPAKGVKKAKKA